MLGIGNADLERLLVLAVVLTILALLVHAVFRGPRLMPQVPPTVSPLLHPLDEDVRGMRHRLDNIDQKMPDIEHRVVRQEEQIRAIRSDVRETKEATERMERMVQVLIEAGLRAEKRL